jgi:hypothetical protein
VALSGLNKYQRKELVLKDFAEYPKAYGVIDYHERDWPTNSWEGGVFTAYLTSGVWTTYGKALRTPVGRIFWAGTEMSTKWLGYIDGGIRAGEKAAADAQPAEMMREFWPVCSISMSPYEGRSPTLDELCSQNAAQLGLDPNCASLVTCMPSNANNVIVDAYVQAWSNDRI